MPGTPRSTFSMPLILGLMLGNPPVMNTVERSLLNPKTGFVGNANGLNCAAVIMISGMPSGLTRTRLLFAMSPTHPASVEIVIVWKAKAGGPAYRAFCEGRGVPALTAAPTSPDVTAPLVFDGAVDSTGKIGPPGNVRVNTIN